MTGGLGNALAEAGQRRRRKIWVALQELFRCPLETYERWRIESICQIPADGPDGCLVADSEAYGMDPGIEIFRIALTEAERKIAEAAINIPHVMEEHASDVAADQRKSQF